MRICHSIQVERRPRSSPAWRGGVDHDLGFYALGGKGATSRKTPHEILDRCERSAVDPGPLLYASRLAAKVDSSALQDGYQLYHHAFFFARVDRETSDTTIDVLHRAAA
jgi:hypothetical protein